MHAYPEALRSDICSVRVVRTCIVRMSNRPKKSLTDTSSSNTVRYISAEVPASTLNTSLHHQRLTALQCSYVACTRRQQQN